MISILYNHFTITKTRKLTPDDFINDPMVCFQFSHWSFYGSVFQVAVSNHATLIFSNCDGSKFCHPRPWQFCIPPFICFLEYLLVALQWLDTTG